MDYLGFSVGIMLGLIAGVALIKEYDHRHAIAAGCASYDAKTGEFKWNKEVQHGH